MLLVLGLTLVGFTIQTVGLVRSCSGFHCDVRSGAGGMIVAGVLGGAWTFAALTLLRKGVGRPARSGTVLPALAVAVFAATPVQDGWDDGCNAHSGSMATGIAYFHAWAGPDEGKLVFYDVHTLMGCY